MSCHEEDGRENLVQNFMSEAAYRLCLKYVQ
jgi:hypothetical protein